MESKRAKRLTALQEAVTDVLVGAVAVHLYPVERFETTADVVLDKATSRYLAAIEAIRAAMLRPTGSRSARPRSGNADKPPRPRKRRASSRRPK